MHLSPVICKGSCRRLFCPLRDVPSYQRGSGGKHSRQKHEDFSPFMYKALPLNAYYFVNH